MQRINSQGRTYREVLAAIEFSWKKQPSSQNWKYSLSSNLLKTRVAELFLECFKEKVKNDEIYANSLKEHYYAFKEKTKYGKSSPILTSKKKIGRNEPCPCGSGKKYKRCCLSKDNSSK